MEDKPVFEADVYLTHGLSTSLYIWQYPLHHDVDNPIDYAKLRNATYRPRNDTFSVDFAIPSYSATSTKDSMALRSSAMPQAASYALGVFQDGNQCYLTVVII